MSGAFRLERDLAIARTKISALKAELEAARKNDKRYLWLRNVVKLHPVDVHRLFSLDEAYPTLDEAIDKAMTYDVAIDAAMRQEKADE